MRAALLLSLIVALPASAEQAKLAVMNLRPAGGIDPQLASAMTDAVASEAGKRGFFQVISSNEITTLLGVERQKTLLGCSDGLHATIPHAKLEEDLSDAGLPVAERGKARALIEAAPSDGDNQMAVVIQCLGVGIEAPRTRFRELANATLPRPPEPPRATTAREPSPTRSATKPSSSRTTVPSGTGTTQSLPRAPLRLALRPAPPPWARWCGCSERDERS